MKIVSKMNKNNDFGESARLTMLGPSESREGQIMEVQIPLDKMTTLDKLRALERIWDDLQRKPEDVPSPSWHGDVLQVRERRVKEGSSQFSDWSEAKSRIRDRTRWKYRFLPRRSKTWLTDFVSMKPRISVLVNTSLIHCFRISTLCSYSQAFIHGILAINESYPRFPFAMYYRVDKDIVRIHAVLDCRQDPKKIQDRLT